MSEPINRIMIRSSDRSIWATDDAIYNQVKDSVSKGRALTLMSSAVSTTTVIGPWEQVLLSEFEHGIKRLRADGLDPDFYLTYRTDIATSAFDTTNEVRKPIDPPNDFPFDLGMHAVDQLDSSMRFIAAAQNFGTGLPRMLNGLGVWDNLSGLIFKMTLAVDGAVYYYGDHYRAMYARKEPSLWAVRAVLLDPTHPLYLMWVVEAAQRCIELIEHDYPALTGLGLELHSKDKHYHVMEDGSFWAPPMTQWNASEFSSGLSTWPYIYQDKPNYEVRAETVRALRLAGIRVLPRFWVKSDWASDYVSAIGEGSWVK